MKSVYIYIATVGVMLTTVFLSGCSPQERSGISRMPHNRPAAWEYNSFAR